LPGYNLDQPTLKPINIGEKGFTGTRIYNGIIDTTQHEWLSQFQGVWNTVDNIDLMRSDAYLASVEKGILQPIVQGDQILSFEDPSALNDPNLKYILSFMQDQFKNNNMTKARRDAALSVIYGFYILENVMEERNNKWHTVKFAPRQPRTAYKWYPDKHGELQTLEQLVYAYAPDGLSGTWEHIPIDKDYLLVFSHCKEGNYFPGRPEFRPLYREWLIKDTVMRTLMTAIGRVGAGVPTAIINDEAPVTTQNADGVSTTGVMDSVIKALESLQNSETVSLVLKHIKSFSFQTVAPQAITALMTDIVRYCDEAMGKSVYQMIVNMGTTATGARALGEVFEDKFIDFETAIAAEIDEVFDQQYIKRMVQWNFGPQKIYPKSHISIKKDMTAIIEVLSSAKQKGLIQGNKDCENIFLRYYNLPETTKENVLPNEKGGASIVSGGFAEPKHNHIHLSEASTTITLNRAPTDRESRIINFAEVSDNLNTILKSLAQDLKSIIEPVMQKAVKQIASGTKIYQLKLPWGNRLNDLYFKYYQKLKKQGAADVKKELAKQNGKSLSEIYFANPKKTAPEPDDYDEYAREQSELNSELMNSAVKASLINYTKDGLDKGLSGDDLADYIMGQIAEEVGQRYTSGAGKITGGYAYAREVTAEEFSEMIKSKFRSEIMDGNTCEPCAEGDGKEYELNEEVPLDCEGGWRCRRIFVYEVA
jgi:hypothetical protein